MRSLVVALIAVLALSVSSLTTRQVPLTASSSFLHIVTATNTIRIVKAVYGLDDVTDSVRALASGKSEVSISATNGVFGDNWYGTVKVLTVVYQVGFGPITTGVAVENTNLQIKSALGNTLRVLGASFGQKDVTASVQSLVNNNELYLNASRTVYNAGLNGYTSTLVVVYQYGNRDPQVVVLKEGESVTIRS